MALIVLKLIQFSYGIVLSFYMSWLISVLSIIFQIKKDESDADNLAFWDIYFDVPKEEKITASLGILSALSSLLFFQMI